MKFSKGSKNSDSNPNGELGRDIVVTETELTELPLVDMTVVEEVGLEPDTSAVPTKKAPRVWSGRKVVALVAVVAVLSLAAGIAIMQFIVSPAELAARTAPPEPGPVTAVVEQRVIENKVVARGEVTYADSVNVDVDAAGGEGRVIVTGSVPEVGALLNAKDVALEVNGRPVIVLAGDLPAYRSLSYGMRGPDVLQLKAALSALGFYVGDVGSDTYDVDTANAVGELFQSAGYQPETGGDAAQDNLRAAQGQVRSAELAVSQAETAWVNARDDETITDMSGFNAELEIARSSHQDAREALWSAQQAVLPSLPIGEVLYLGGLPRRVDDIYVARGDALSNPTMTVSGATLTISGTFSSQDAALLEVGMKALYALPNGEEKEASITVIQAPKSSAGSSEDEEGGGGGGSQTSTSDRYTVQFDPGELTEEQISELRGNNVRLSIPIASTDGEVLAVPVAALSAASDGGSRVELLVEDPVDPNLTELIDVTTGLAAGGFVEITSEDPRLKSGAKVVVGR